MALSMIARRLTSIRPAAVAMTTSVRHYAEAVEAPTLSLTFGTPREAFFDGVGVNQVDVPSTTGCFGLLANHVPVIACLKPGVLTVYSSDGKSDQFFVSSGTVTMNNDSSCQILAEEAAPLDRFDVASTKSNLELANQALAKASGEEEKAAAQVEADAYISILEALEKK